MPKLTLIHPESKQEVEVEKADADRYESQGWVTKPKK